MVVGQVYDYWYQHREGLLLVTLEDIQKVIVLKETHGSVCHLQVDATDAPDNALEELLHQVLDLVYLTDLKNFLKFSKEKRLLYAVRVRPVSQ